MSGGFFRGTSADQDTRFSNKQAKLLKSQKFASELDQLVDMTKVKMDVIKPWIATRATELLGFEDEVLINFIYGLLDGKDVDGKQIQIQLTGFMEKNTGKFMRELWTLLLSAQKNASGIPQQFLDAKEEETRKKKAESDRITHEIQKKKEKEGRELELGRPKTKDGEADVSRARNASDEISKKGLSIHSDNEREVDGMNVSRRKERLSGFSHSASSSPSRRKSPSPRSRSRSFSHSRSDSDERHKSKSISRSPQPQRHSVSPPRRCSSPLRRSTSPHDKQIARIPLSPRRGSSSYSKRRSLSPRHRRSPSPKRRKSPSPRRRRSPSPRRRRSPSPRRRKSPSPRRRRSPSPRRRRSPLPRHARLPSPSRRRSRSPRRYQSRSARRHISPSPRRRRSPSPLWRRSPPMRRRSPSPVKHISSSPMRRRSPPVRRKSPSPSWHKSPSPRLRSASPSQRSPSPLRKRSPPTSPKHRQSPLKSLKRHSVDSEPTRQKYRSPSPSGSQSPHPSERSLSTEHDINGIDSRKVANDNASERSKKKIFASSGAVGGDQIVNHASELKRGDALRRQVSREFPQRNPREDSNGHSRGMRSDSSSPSQSPPHKRKISPDRQQSSSGSSPKQVRESVGHHQTPGQSRKEKEIRYSSRKKSSLEPDWKEVGPDRATASRLQARSDHMESKKRDLSGRSDNNSPAMDVPEKQSRQMSHVSEEIEYGPAIIGGASLDAVREKSSVAKHRRRHSLSADEGLCNEQFNPKSSAEKYRVHKKKHSATSNDKYIEHHHKEINIEISSKKSDSSESDSHRNKASKSHSTEKRKHKKTDSYGDIDYDSEIDERKEAKRRRKEEKKLRKEEKRCRREERHRRREERHARKLKSKTLGIVTPSDVGEHHDDEDTDGNVDRRDASGSEETELEQKRLEIELRKKALESLRAKKAISH